MNKKKDRKILVIGELNVDIILNSIEGFPTIGTEITAGSMDFTLGSSSAIMASNISSMGISTSFCGLLGKDLMGDFILDFLRKKKVDTTFALQDPYLKTGVTVVMNYEEDRANITYCGAMEHLGLEMLPWNKIEDFDHLHLSSFFLQQGLRPDIPEIFKRARAAGLTTSLDLQWDPENKWDFDFRNCLPFIDVFLPNEKELLHITHADHVEAAIEILKPYACLIALKMGSKGSRLYSPTEILEAPSFINKTYFDSIGAGDSFNAGFLKKFIEGASMPECLVNGNLMGSLSTTRPGGTGAFTSKEEIEELEEKIKNKKI